MTATWVIKESKEYSVPDSCPAATAFSLDTDEVNYLIRDILSGAYGIIHSRKRFFRAWRAGATPMGDFNPGVSHSESCALGCRLRSREFRTVGKRVLHQELFSPRHQVRPIWLGFLFSVWLGALAVFLICYGGDLLLRTHVLSGLSSCVFGVALGSMAVAPRPGTGHIWIKALGNASLLLVILMIILSLIARAS
ncbi:hypothetical protein P5P86_19890 [Nocardioides sp. BP30]|uniref:hypothetical protein n=1 Tax=Nocardioides sp. BP30 TaxID=3036374 RepID=UPI0024686E2C|nr:hypothetical protein [Nocardioides sp. BP30]WGL52200.1 hypothetical protein P5P86_19890 [Nocardioides sp. BP30]